MKKLLVAVVLGLMMVFPSAAAACSLPYVGDVVYRTDGRFNVCIQAASGSKVKAKVASKHGKVKVRRMGKLSFLCVLKRNVSYKISVKDHGKWKSIKYTIC